MRCAVTPRVSYLGFLHPRVALGQRILIGLASHEIRIIGPILLRFPPHSEAGALCPRLLICVLHGPALWYKGFCLWPNGAGSGAKGFWSKLLLAFMASGLKMPVGRRGFLAERASGGGLWCPLLSNVSAEKGLCFWYTGASGVKGSRCNGLLV